MFHDHQDGLTRLSVNNKASTVVRHRT